MCRSCLVAIVPGVLAVMVGALVLMLLVVKLLWAWTIPDLFPGAVEQGLVVGEISWYVAFKVAVFVAVVAGIGRASVHRDHS